MNVIKAIFLRLARTAAIAVVDEALKIAVKEANEELQEQVDDEAQLVTLKEAVSLVEAKVREIINSKLGV